MLVIGLDENGLGPVLGPLVVTAVAFRAKTYSPKTFWSLAGDDLPAADSKEIFKRSRPAPGEDAIRRWLALFDVPARSHLELACAVERTPPMNVPCPDEENPACAPATSPLPLWAAPRSGISLGVWNRFDEAGVAPDRVAAHVLCPGAFNEAMSDPAANKLELDFQLMLSLIGELKDGDEEIVALCGKIGSTRRYEPWFEALGLHVDRVLEERREVSRYSVAGIGEISFIRDGDASHLPIAVASMVGKYLRELSMERLNQVLCEGGPRVSGYRDKVTARMIEDTIGRREAVRLPDTCFIRGR